MSRFQATTTGRFLPHRPCTRVLNDVSGRLEDAQRQLLRAAVELKLGVEASEARAENAFTAKALVVDRDISPPTVGIPDATGAWRSLVGPAVRSRPPIFELPIATTNR